jgi:hypothetical protein
LLGWASDLPDANGMYFYDLEAALTVPGPAVDL